MADTPFTGVYPVYDQQFKIGAASNSVSTIADMESFSVSFDNNIETWYAIAEDGWQKALLTGKAITISVNGKRNVGDTGNDFVAGMAFKNGREAECVFQWTFKDGTVVEFDNAVIDVREMGGGDSTNVAPLNFDIHSNGKPTVTPAA